MIAPIYTQVLEQRFHHVERERDELYEKFESTIYDVQQKSGFKNILLERKLQATLHSTTALYCAVHVHPARAKAPGDTLLYYCTILYYCAILCCTVLYMYILERKLQAWACAYARALSCACARTRACRPSTIYICACAGHQPYVCACAGHHRCIYVHVQAITDVYMCMCRPSPIYMYVHVQAINDICICARAGHQREP